MKTILYTIACLIGLVSTNASYAYNWEKEGERLTYDVKWSFLHVGQAELLFKPVEDDYNIMGRAWTGDSMGLMYDLQDRLTIHGSLKNNTYYTDQYVAELNENDYKAHKQVNYNRHLLKADYTNIHAGHKPAVYDIEKNSRDMISALYFLRSKQENVQVGDVYELPIFDLDSHYIMNMNVLKKETLKTTLGKIETFKIQPVLVKQNSEKKKKKDRLFIWVTADEKLIPVKIEIDLKFGDFRAILTDNGDSNSESFAPSFLPETGHITKQERKPKFYVNFTDD